MVYRKSERVLKQLEGKREGIVAAARALILKGGFSEAPIAAVAKRAGVATGTVYRYFPSKADLLAEVVRQTSQHELDVIIAIARTPAAPHERFERAMRTFLSRAIRGYRLAYVLLVEPIDATVWQARIGYRRALAAVLADLIREAIADGKFREQDADIVAAAIVGAMNENLIAVLSPNGPDTERCLDRLVESLTTFCLAAVAR